MSEDLIDGGSRDMQSIVMLVVREAVEECGAGNCPVHFVLEQCARQAVESLWDSRIKSFVPLLALQSVRTCIRNGHCDDTDTALVSGRIEDL